MTTLTWRVEQRAVNMAAMMLHLGIWPETSFAGLPMESAIRTCFLCPQADRCSDWLVDSKAHPMAWQRFCPNAKLFTLLCHKPIEEMLDDPLIQLVMASDGVRREDLEQLFRDLRSRSRPRPPTNPDSSLRSDLASLARGDVPDRSGLLHSSIPPENPKRWSSGENDNEH